MRQHKGEHTELHSGFRKWATAQLRMMFFVGHGSIALTISYTFYLLSKNPDASGKMRDEHDEVLGDTTRTPHRLRTVSAPSHTF